VALKYITISRDSAAYLDSNFGTPPPLLYMPRVKTAMEALF
jgi:hypothetical protein